MKTYHNVEVNGIEIFYRQAGNPDKPVIVLLHGFPSASHMFRDLMPVLEEDFFLIAPDYPGFGNSSSPDRTDFQYTFENITHIIDCFISKLKLTKYALYVFDYGAPIGFRIAMRNPERITAIISQNGNVYREGLGAKWAAREEFWRNPTHEKRESYRIAFAPETIRKQYIDGTKDNRVSPDGYILDSAYMSRPGNGEKQLDLIYDYQTNVKMYPRFQQYLQQYQPALLAVWGENDVSFIPAGAVAFKKDLPDSEIHLLDTGHFALETHAKEIGELMINFFEYNEIR
ncbi:hydrolase, alpha/beta fold family protein [Paenibacillus terrae HPL-003]|uniref:Hydrolase, alpha/beta fold family protein n=1 Tax=Paenibacillus terrae (strain HPL-003) TaxID=985665 RepID=G7VW86_PAETH|nr:alpha/beta hydrolase [Paenibacillus terrae]AET58887.1 hydrolase, alpha/beta fold family protein [Paenibacillus terrae HPL-003]